MWKGSPSLPLAVPLPLPGVFPGHLTGAPFLLPLGQTLSVALAGSVLLVLLEVSWLSFDLLGCLCQRIVVYLATGVLVAFLESMEKRVWFLLSCQLNSCV